MQTIGKDWILMPSMCRVITPCSASEKDLKLFHSADYIDCLKAVSNNVDAESVTEKLEEFGLGNDNYLATFTCYANCSWL
jgi:acetoin utilization deacetylase AcuC-like enzyme